MNLLLLSFCLSFGVMLVVGVGAYRNRPQTQFRKVAYLLGAVFFLGGILNFIIYWHVNVHLGGKAIAGTVENGKYYLASHGKRTEVSSAIWRYSDAHAKSTPITHALALLGAVLMYLTGPKRRDALVDAAGHGPSESQANRVV